MDRIKRFCLNCRKIFRKSNNGYHLLGKIPPAYSVGRVTNKYLIFEIFAYSGRNDQVFPFISMVNRNIRGLLIKN